MNFDDIILSLFRPDRKADEGKEKILTLTLPLTLENIKLIKRYSNALIFC